MLTFVTVLYSDGSLGGFVVSDVTESFTFPGEFIFDDDAVFNVSVLLEDRQERCRPKTFILSMAKPCSNTRKHTRLCIQLLLLL